MKAETRYTIAFLAGKLANPTSQAKAVNGPEGTKYFSGEVTASSINVHESAAGTIRGSGSNNYFSKIQVAGQAEDFELKVTGNRLEAHVAGEKVEGTLAGLEIKFDSGERYDLK